jgi:hypothetical protein
MSRRPGQNGEAGLNPHTIRPSIRRRISHMSVRPTNLALVLALLAALAPAVASTQTRVRTAPEYSTDVLGDPWDFNEAGDFVYMQSVHAVGMVHEFPWTARPVVSGGMLTGTARLAVPSLQLLAFNAMFSYAGRNGVSYPIDADRYSVLSFRLRRSRTPSDPNERFSVIWWTPTGVGSLHAPTRGYEGSLARRYVNQSPVDRQADATFHIYKLDLKALGERDADWRGRIEGLQLFLGNSPELVGATLDLDWVRLSQPGVARTRLVFSNLGGPVTVTARHQETGDVIHIFPDNATSATTFPDNSAFDWDYGFLPPGTWVLTASGSAGQTSNTLVVDPAPVIHLTEPDAEGGRDFATTVLGDPWDMRNPEDLRTGLPFGHTTPHQTTDLSFGENGLTATSTGNDPFIGLLDDSGKPPGTATYVDASTYRHLSFTVEYLDGKDLTWGAALSDEWGSMMRVHWKKSASVGFFTGTKDIVLYDGGPARYSIDLGALGAAELVTVNDLWQGTLGVLRVDVNEATRPRRFRLADVKLAADDEPNAHGRFLIRWRTTDATFTAGLPDLQGADATVRLEYDTDTNPHNGRMLIAHGVPASAGQYLWDMSAVSPRLARGGRYWIAATITDGAGNSQMRYSGGPIRVPDAGLPDTTDANGNGMADAWEQRYGVTDPHADPDGDGLTNLQEYEQGTHPLLPNRVVLAEGSTTIFQQRLALANPDTVRARVKVTFLREAATPIEREFTVNPLSRLDVAVNTISGLESASFSTVVDALEGGVVAERTMFWGGWGGHTGKGSPAPRTSWYLAEGDAGFFNTFILLANPNATAASVAIEYFFEEPERAPVTRTYPVGARQRYTVETRTDPALLGRSFSARITSNVPINVERAMYFKPHPTTFYQAGHASGAIEAPGTDWFLAEGATLAEFSTYLLLANPNSTTVDAEITYLRQGATAVSGRQRLAPLSRKTILLNAQPGLAGVPVSMRVTASLPIIAERAMYWPGDFASWLEGHASAGLTTPGTEWSLAEGEHGGSRGFATYILVANPSGQPASVTVTLLRTNGQPLSLALSVPAHARGTVSSHDFAAIGLGSGEQFGALVTSTNHVPIVVERAMYWSGAGQAFGGGTNETGVKLR